MKEEKSEYDIQAEKFLKDTNTSLNVEFDKLGLHFEGDKEERDIYNITLKRGNRVFKFKFGNSINCSVKYKIYTSKGIIKTNDDKIKVKYRGTCSIETNKDFKIPSAYDVLTCLTTYDVGTFKDFCGEFGYDEDSIKAEKTYKAVLNEWVNIQRLYTDEEILKLGEIQ